AEGLKEPYDRYIVEYEAPDRGFVIVLRGEVFGKDYTTYSKYILTRQGRLWQVTGAEHGQSKVLDPNKNQGRKNGTKEPDKPGPPLSIEEEAKAAVAGVQFVPLDMKLNGIEFTMQAPQGATAREDIFGTKVKHGERFQLELGLGQRDLPL